MKRLTQVLSADECAKLDNMMWILRKHHECLSKHEKDQLALLYRHSPHLKEAHKYALMVFSKHYANVDHPF